MRDGHEVPFSKDTWCARTATTSGGRHSIASFYAAKTTREPQVLTPPPSANVPRTRISRRYERPHPRTRPARWRLHDARAGTGLAAGLHAELPKLSTWTA
ncbi:hypothetical protein GCM10017687_30910 [Streptomyces echinatus]